MSAANDLLQNYQHIISSLKLIPESGGVFDVTAGTSLLYSKHKTGRHANEGEILALFTDMVGPDVPKYGA